ncbi:hypothetical protein Cgig2_034012 [Carnegiea gigantea]|uniref:Uncharacterized protein n=1 Tax=Carnegiea gigantea TaxID=171969 RepID=A0A9Q1JWM5_9CARY|nr:hypothetical protein Cgig2_034012 [Carnegiea gigantea]
MDAGNEPERQRGKSSDRELLNWLAKLSYFENDYFLAATGLLILENYSKEQARVMLSPFKSRSATITEVAAKAILPGRRGASLRRIPSEEGTEGHAAQSEALDPPRRGPGGGRSLGSDPHKGRPTLSKSAEAERSPQRRVFEERLTGRLLARHSRMGAFLAGGLPGEPARPLATKRQSGLRGSEKGVAAPAGRGVYQDRGRESLAMREPPRLSNRATIATIRTTRNASNNSLRPWPLMIFIKRAILRPTSTSEDDSLGEPEDTTPLNGEGTANKGSDDEAIVNDGSNDKNPVRVRPNAPPMVKC